MKKITLLIIVMLIFCAQSLYAEYTPEFLKDPKSLPDYRKIKPFNGSLEIKKPTVCFRVTNKNTGKAQDSYAGKDCDVSIPILVATVGDIINFKDLSTPKNLKSWDWQYYGVEGSNSNIYNKNPLDGLEVKLTKVGITTFYLAVMSDAETTNGILPWSDNGNHQAIGPKTATAPNGLFWYFTAITVKTVAAPTPTKQTVKPTPKPTPKSTPKPAKTSAPTARSANITASASVYYVSDPGVDSIKSGYGFRLEVDTNVVVSPKPGATDPKPTGAKKATAYFLGKAYPMEIKSSSKTAVSFYLPKNSDSVTNARKIYIPVETADGTYDIAIYIEASYNGKPVSKTIHKSITVKGNMYQDDYTAPKD